MVFGCSFHTTWRLTVFMVYVSSAMAGWDQMCTQDDYSAARRFVSTCGGRLSSMILRRCERYGGVYTAKKRSINSQAVKSDYDIYKSIFSNRDSANSLLRPANQKRSSKPRGIVCECCVHRCNQREMLEYCAEPPMRRKRSLLQLGALPDEGKYRSIESQADVDEFYRQIEKDAESLKDQDAVTVDVREFESQPLIKLLERQKQANIQRAQNSKRGSEEDFDTQEGQRLKDFLRARYKAMLANDREPYSVSQPSAKGDNSDYSLLYELYELFKDEQPSKPSM